MKTLFALLAATTGFLAMPASSANAYCASNAATPGYEWIAEIRLNGSTKTSGASGQTSFPGVFAQLEQGLRYTLEIDIFLPDDLAQFCPKSEYLTAWIDFSQDNTYSNSTFPTAGGELIEVGENPKTELACNGIYTFSQDFTVPLLAPLGTTGMRLMLKFVNFGGSNYQCDTGFAGEVEDYTVEIIPTKADLALTSLTDSADPVQEGQDITYTATVENLRPVGATSVKTTTQLPPGLLFKSGTAGPGGCNESGGTVTCDVGDLAANATKTVTIVTLADAVGMVTLPIVVSSFEEEMNTGDNDASEETTINEASSTIGDLVWDDLNGDGVQDVDEPGLAGVTVDLVADDNGDGVADAKEPVLASVTTGSAGEFDFTALRLGDYVVVVTDTDNVLDGYTLTGGAEPLAVTVANDEDSDDADFGYHFQPIVVESDGDAGAGTEDASDAGAAGETVDGGPADTHADAGGPEDVVADIEDAGTAMDSASDSTTVGDVDGGPTADVGGVDAAMEVVATTDVVADGTTATDQGGNGDSDDLGGDTLASDVLPETGVTDTAVDTGADVAADATADTANVPDTTTDTGLDALADVQPDAAPEVTGDSSTDVSGDVATTPGTNGEQDDGCSTGAGPPAAPLGLGFLVLLLLVMRRTRA